MVRELFASPRGKGINESFSLFLYENDYVKENGKWRFKTVMANIVYTYQNPQSGFVNPARFWTAVEGPDFNPEIPIIAEKRDLPLILLQNTPPVILFLSISNTRLPEMKPARRKEIKLWDIRCRTFNRREGLN